jgi:hypothetical protein
MELEPGSEVDLDQETDSDSEEASSPDSRPELREGAEDTPDFEHTESPSSEASLSEEPQSRESSNDTFTGSDPDSAKKGLPKEKSVEDRDTREKPIRDNSTDDDSTGENSDGEDQPNIPDWALAPGKAKEIDLRRGERVALADLPDALRGALPQLRDPNGPEGLFIRCTGDLKVQIRSRQGEDSQIIEASIEHFGLQRSLRNGRDLSEERVLRQAIIYLHDMNWTLPRSAYDLVGTLPNPADAEGPFSEERPRWRLQGASDGLGPVFFGAQITGVLAEGFGIEKDEEVFVGT